MSSLSPTQRTLRELKRQGFVAAVVERFNPYAIHLGKKGRPAGAGIRQDLFGIIDIIALDHSRGVIGVQACGADFSAHHRKLTEEKVQECVDWLNTPGAVLELWGWRKIKAKRGGKQMIWRPRIKIYEIYDFIDPLADA